MKKQLNSVLQEKEEELEKNNQKLLTLGALLNDEEGNLSEEERKNHTLEVIKLSAATIRYFLCLFLIIFAMFRLREQVTSTKAMMKSDVERERKWTKDFQKIEQELESVKRKFSQLD